MLLYQRIYNSQVQQHTFIRNYALSTLLDLKQEVHTYNLFGVPFTLHFTDLILDFHILFDLL